MSIAQYINDALRTAPTTVTPPPGIALAMANNDSKWFDLVHAALGVHGEAEELAQAESYEDIVKEVGDLLWYCALATRGIVYETFQPSAWFEILTRTHRTPIEAPAEMVKKAMFYGSKINDSTLVNAIFRWAARAIQEKAESHKFSVPLMIDVAMVKNIEKLRRRYPNKFEESLAQTHDSQ